MFLCGVIVGGGIGLVLGTLAGVFVLSVCVVSGRNDTQKIIAENFTMNDDPVADACQSKPDDTVEITIELDKSVYQALVEKLQVEPYMTVEQAIESLCRQAIAEYAPETTPGA
ncbi:MAG: hypothetical protein JW741_06070 [Sedimentisphaerales bacterium]|nr:hypothetical protein [Sedimentisphaerales bacterium]